MKTMGQLKAEIQTVVRVCKVPEGILIEELIGWIDYHYHGVVGPAFAETDNSSAVLPDTSQPEGRGLEE